MRTSMMMFGVKPKKIQSKNPKDKRRISLLNCDFKLVEGLEARRFRKIGNRALSPNQYVAGKDRKIHHGIAKARDAIQAAMRAKLGCGIARLGVDAQLVRRVQNLYEESITIVVVNNKLGRVFLDKRGLLRQ